MVICFSQAGFALFTTTFLLRLARTAIVRTTLALAVGSVAVPRRSTLTSGETAVPAGARVVLYVGLSGCGVLAVVPRAAAARCLATALATLFSSILVP